MPTSLERARARPVDRGQRRARRGAAHSASLATDAFIGERVMTDAASVLLGTAENVIGR